MFVLRQLRINKSLPASCAISCGYADGLSSWLEGGQGTVCLPPEQVIEPDQPLELSEHVVILKGNNEPNPAVFVFDILLLSCMY